MLLTTKPSLYPERFLLKGSRFFPAVVFAGPRATIQCSILTVFHPHSDPGVMALVLYCYLYIKDFPQIPKTSISFPFLLVKTMAESTHGLQEACGPSGVSQGSLLTREPSVRTLGFCDSIPCRYSIKGYCRDHRYCRAQPQAPTAFC